MKNFDLISREALLKKAQALMSFDGKEVVWVRDDVLLAPTIDPVHAADACYCRECKYLNSKYFEAGEGNYYCHRTDKRTELTDFCSYGERRESEDKNG